MPTLTAEGARLPPAPEPEGGAGEPLSLCGRRWLMRAADERTARAIAQRHGVPDVIARALAARGVGLEEVPGFLSPTLRADLPDPSILLDMDRAADRIARAVIAGEPVAVFGDYDVDGACSAAMLLRFLAALGVGARLHVPDRRREGYGPNAPALLALGRAGVRLVVTVDCGTLAFEPLAAAAEAGLDVIVLDHHAAETRLPRATAIVNPNRADERHAALSAAGRLGQLAACGVTFLALVATARALRRAGWFGARPEPDLLGLLDLVALGTVADVVPLTGLNRTFVVQGLKVMARRRNPGLAALADRAKLSQAPDAMALGFVLGPRVNAGGRIGRSDLGARLLSAVDAGEAAAIAGLLDGHNEDRKAIEAGVLAEAIAAVEAMADPGPAIVAAREGWHPGVAGIVAARLKERYARPACVIALEGGIGRGSGRSVPGFDLGTAVVEARRAGLLLAGGGHPMAAGFTVAAGRIVALRAFLAERIGRLAPGPLVPVLELDGALAVGAATPDFVATLARLGPFGSGNPEPRFLLSRVRAIWPRIVGGDHIAATLAGLDGRQARAIAFRSVGTPLGTALLTADGTPLDLAGTIRADGWNGQMRVQVHIEDARPA